MKVRTNIIFYFINYFIDVIQIKCILTKNLCLNSFSYLLNNSSNLKMVTKVFWDLLKGPIQCIAYSTRNKLSFEILIELLSYCQIHASVLWLEAVSIQSNCVVITSHHH